MNDSHTCSVLAVPVPPRDRAARCDGFSLVEVLVTLALMGTTVVAVLVGVQATVRASVTDRDHATAFAWLQSASDEIYRVDREPCTGGKAAAIAAYDSAAASVTPPPVWDSTDAAISVIDVEFLGKSGVDDEFEWSDTFCFEGPGYDESPLYTQRVTLRVNGPASHVVKTMQMVKSE